MHTKFARKCSYDPLRVRFSTQWIFKHTVYDIELANSFFFSLSFRIYGAVQFLE